VTRTQQHYKMNKNILTFLFCLTTIHCFAIEFYKPGDTLWVWAKNGLNIREQPDAHSKILSKAENGGQVISLEYQNIDFPYSVEEIKKRVRSTDSNEKVECPGLEFTGYWAKINYKGVVGYVFDAYLSKLQTFIGHQYEVEHKEDFHVFSLKKYAKVLKQIGEDKYDKNDHKFVRYIFDTGHIIDISGGSGYWQKEMLFPNNLSLMEGYLIYSHTMKSETDILLSKGEDYLYFEIETGFLTIKRVGSFLVIYEKHAC
jgi:hypothetical protein